MTRMLLCKISGFTTLALLLALSVLSAMGLSMVSMIANNQATRTQQLYIDQSFMSAYSGLEFAKKQLTIDSEMNPIPTRQFAGTTLSISRTGWVEKKIRVIGTKESASTTVSITDLDPPSEAKCLSINTASAAWSANEKKLIGITLQREAINCPDDIQLIGMRFTWSPCSNKKISEIHIGGDQPKEFNNQASQYGCGDYIPFTNPYDFYDTQINELKWIQWKQDPNTTNMTIVFYMSDTSTATVTLRL